MEATDILVVGLKGTVLAFERNSGKPLWRTKVAGGLTGSGFVSLVADQRLVFAHTGGKLYCLDLLTGTLLWQDGLAGMGYGIASLAFPDGAVSPATEIMQEILNRKEREHSTTTTSSQSH